MVKEPLVSVCVPVYNGEKYVVETIESIRSQTYPNIEIVVQDNASTDNTWSIVQSLAKLDSRLSIERNDRNCGMAGNWNTVIDRARGDYVMLLSADDLLMPEFVEKCLGTFRALNVGAVSTNHFLLRNGRQFKRKLPIAAKVYQQFSHVILLFNPFSINFTLFSRQLLDRARVSSRVFAKAYYTCDYELWIRLSFTQENVAYLDETLGIYRVHAENLSRQTKRMSRQAALTVLSHKSALRKHCHWTYRFTLLRFILRGVRDALRDRSAADSRLLRVLAGELLR